MAVPSPFFRNALLFKGSHAMPGSQMHKLLTEKKDKEAEALQREIMEKEVNLMKQAEKLSKQAT